MIFYYCSFLVNFNHTLALDILEVKKELQKIQQLDKTANQLVEEVSQVKENLNSVHSISNDISETVNKVTSKALSCEPSALFSTSFSILKVQSAIPTRRKPIQNLGFELFTVLDNEYKFRGKSLPKTCQHLKTMNNCDHLNLFKVLLENTNFDYYYLIEDDTFYCGNDEHLVELASFNLPLILTGIGASGMLIKRTMIEQVVNEGIVSPGLDLLIAFNYNQFSYRYYMNLNIHLYEGSTLSHDHGGTDSLYPTCFEISCQNEAGRGNYDHFNFKNCTKMIHKCDLGPNECSTEMPEIVRKPICSKFCKMKCPYSEYAILN